MPKHLVTPYDGDIFAEPGDSGLFVYYNLSTIGEKGRTTTTQFHVVSSTDQNVRLFRLHITLTVC